MKLTKRQKELVKDSIYCAIHSNNGTISRISHMFEDDERHIAYFGLDGMLEFGGWKNEEEFRKSREKSKNLLDMVIKQNEELANIIELLK